MPPSVACDKIVPAHEASGERGSEVFEHFVAAAMAVDVVDPFEVINIHHQEASTLSKKRCQVDLALDLLVECGDLNSAPPTGNAAGH
ncbi:MAG: hypothetical protein ABGX04_08350 [Myxococcales bacterium]